MAITYRWIGAAETVTNGTMQFYTAQLYSPHAAALAAKQRESESMSITTLEQFEALADGTTISVGNTTNVWTKSGDKWSRSGITLDSLHFEGDILRNRVTVGVRPEVGQAWQVGRYDYIWIILRAADEGGFWCSVHDYQGNYVQVSRTTEMPGTVMSETPSWVTLASAMGASILEYRRAHEQSNTSIRELRERVRTVEREARQAGTAARLEFRQEVAPAFHEVLRELSDDDAKGPILRFMSRHGIELPTEQVNVRITVKGLSEVAADPEVLRANVPEGAALNSDAATFLTVPWVREFVISREVSLGYCACDDIDSDTVESLLVGMEYTEWEYEAACDNDN